MASAAEGDAGREVVGDGGNRGESGDGGKRGARGEDREEGGESSALLLGVAMPAS